MHMSHYFLRNAGQVGKSTEIDSFNFSQIFLHLILIEKHHVYFRNVKFCVKTLISRFSNKS